MIKKSTLLFAAALLIAAAFQANAGGASDVSSTASLVANCRVVVAAEDDGYSKKPTNDSMFNAGACMGYIEGLRAGLDLLKATTPRARACIPQEATVGQLARILVKWSNEHPELLHKLKAVGATDAWSEAFPCGVEG